MTAEQTQLRFAPSSSQLPRDPSESLLTGPQAAEACLMLLPALTQANLAPTLHGAAQTGADTEHEAPAEEPPE